MNFEFGGLTLLMIIQILNIIFFIRSSSKDDTDAIRMQKYSIPVIKHGNNAICAVEAGKIKKQLIENDAPIFDSYTAMCQYINFVDSSIAYKKIQTLKENRYYG